MSFCFSMTYLFTRYLTWHNKSVLNSKIFTLCSLPDELDWIRNFWGIDLSHKSLGADQTIFYFANMTQLICFNQYSNVINADYYFKQKIYIVRILWAFQSIHLFTSCNCIQFTPSVSQIFIQFLLCPVLTGWLASL